jgi:hypothetical protein
MRIGHERHGFRINARHCGADTNDTHRICATQKKRAGKMNECPDHSVPPHYVRTTAWQRGHRLLRSAFSAVQLNTTPIVDNAFRSAFAQPIRATDQRITVAHLHWLPKMHLVKTNKKRLLDIAFP